MRKIMMYSMLLLSLIILAPTSVSAQDVYFATTRAVTPNGVIMADYYYDDASIVGSKANGRVSVIIKAVAKSSGNLLGRPRLSYRYYNGEWYLETKVHPGEKVSTMPGDSAPRMLFNCLP
ncbi:hypothetical protein [Anaerovibrio lipolyticus]|uniref:hypothetical protein n=1 Tax=Anaerovibrio lipolyticus TaxID=82374 RepID=UPI0023F4749C|nr:hypothetical protein [Anaerovibrio lipolyticus]